MRKRIITMVAVLVFAIVFTVGCTPIENMIVDEPAPDEMVNGPMSEIEYTNAKDRILNDAVNDGSIILGRALDLKRGSLLVADEIARVEDSIDKAQKNIEELGKLTPPPSCKDQQTQAVKGLSDYKATLENYYAVLSTENYDLIPTCTDSIKSAISTVKMVFGTI